MATVKMILKSTDKPSKEQLKRLKEAADRPIVFDEDSPEMTDEMLSRFRRVYPKSETVKG